MKNINIANLIPLDILIDKEPIQIDIVYADAEHPRNIFGEAIYRKNVRLWAHRDMAVIILLTARFVSQRHGWTLCLKDCLRTTDAQTRMEHTDIAKKNPQWTIEPRFLSPAGMGGHPRGMAIDVHPMTSDGKQVDMGTEFDEMIEGSARDFKGHSEDVLNNRRHLENAFIDAAFAVRLPLYALPNEWWDFRLPGSYNGAYAPLSDADLPPQMQMTHKIANNIPDFDDAHFERLAESILAMIEPHNGNL